MASSDDIESGRLNPQVKENEKNHQVQGSGAAAGKWWCCGSDEEKEEDKEVAKQKEAYKTLIKHLEWAEESNVSGLHKRWVGIEFIVIPGVAAAMACTLTLDQMKHERLYGLRMWQYVMMATALFAGLSIIRWITKVVFWAVLRWRWMHRDLGYFLRAMKTSVDVTLWLCTVLFAWYVWFRPRLKHVYGDVSVVLSHQLTRLLIAICLGSLLWVAKNALFFWLEADLHYRQLCGHITRTICQLHVLQILHNLGVWTFLNHPKDKKRLQELLDPRNAESLEAMRLNKCCMMLQKPKDDEFPKGMSQKDKVDVLQRKGKNICKELLHVKRDNVPVWILRRLCEEYMEQVQTRPLPVDKKIIQNPEMLMNKALRLFHDMKQANQHYSRTNSSSERENDDDEMKLADLERRYQVTREDLELFMTKINPRDNIDESQQNDLKDGGPDFNSIAGGDRDNSSKKEVSEDAEIGRDEFCSWAVVAYRNCWGLRNTLKSSEQIIFKLNRMMMVFVLVLSLIIWLLLSEIVDSAQIALLFSPLLAAKFIFSESTKNMFDGLIFALAMHPFNPGDRVIVHGMEAIKLLVMEINILSTTFYKYQSGEELVYPNSELATTQIINLENVPDQSDQIEFTISKDTPLEDIRDLEIKIQISLDYRRDAFKTKVVKTEMGLENIKMTVQFNYVGSYLTSEMKAVHRSEMLSTIMQLLKKMKPNSDEKEEMPSTCKPYIVDVILNKKVKLEHVQTIRDAIQGSLSKYSKRGELNCKVVGNNVSGKHVRMAFYVWKNSTEQHEIISNEQLGIIQRDISCTLVLKSPQKVSNTTSGKGQPGGSSNSADDGGSNQSLVFAYVQIQTKPGIAEIKYQPESDEPECDNKIVEDAIKRYFCKKCYQYEFEVKIMGNLLYIYAWRQFPHGIEEEKHLLNVQQILDDKTLQEINKLEELTGVHVQIHKVTTDQVNDRTE